jgi:NADH dehydrogenase
VRRLPVFLVPGRGDYRVQPVSVADVARIAVEAGAGSDDVTLDAAGPEEYAFEELVRLVAEATDARARIVHARPGLAVALARVFGLIARDVLLTREELDALAASTLVSDEPPRGTESFRAWLREHGDDLGRRYVSELGRNFRPYAPV